MRTWTWLTFAAVVAVLGGCQAPLKRVSGDHRLGEPSGLREITIVAKGVE